ncbi:hypothetical protein LPB72_15175 [Hydrogenophaga crassostreae]|uniref:Uncharacterized protein n=1 Tax=Hydrogenophaga crassostreae TaxID=1763535 RepID=A0A162P4F5_9BURK|nr:hypothetical protein LPB072_04925 [Hydrogenophaga crassostreae]OAD41242.1 hypothetical protein LPB72_15175 [Hydrogenophaga crassostreae]
MVNRNHYFSGHTSKTGLELDEIVAQSQPAGGIHSDVENNLTFFNELHRHLHRRIHLHRKVR